MFCFSFYLVKRSNEYSSFKKNVQECSACLMVQAFSHFLSSTFAPLLCAQPHDIFSETHLKKQPCSPPVHPHADCVARRATNHTAEGDFISLSPAIIPHTLLSFLLFYQTEPHIIISIRGLIGREVSHYDENTDLILRFIQTFISFSYSIRLFLSPSFTVTCGNVTRGRKEEEKDRRERVGEKLQFNVKIEGGKEIKCCSSRWSLITFVGRFSLCYTYTIFSVF